MQHSIGTYHYFCHQLLFSLVYQASLLSRYLHFKASTDSSPSTLSCCKMLPAEKGFMTDLAADVRQVVSRVRLVRLEPVFGFPAQSHKFKPIEANGVPEEKSSRFPRVR